MDDLVQNIRTNDTLPDSATPWLNDDHETATAIVLAGGKSTRMGADKSLLPFMGKPLIEHVCMQLRPHFEEVIIAGGELRRLAFLNARIIPDQVPGQGPLRGIASALTASRHDLNFVIACDIPWVNIALLRKLLREAHDCDCVVPITSEGHHEPLFSVYRKSALPSMMRALDEGERRIISAFRYCLAKTVSISEEESIKNINTLSDYTMLTRPLEQDCSHQRGMRPS